MAGYRKIYNINDIGVNVGVSDDAFPIEGIRSLSATINNPTYTTHVAASGTFRTVRSNDKSGKLTVVIANWSASHDKLFLLDKLGVQFPVVFVDKGSTAGVVVGDGCMIEKMPDWERGAEEGDTTYVFTCGSLEIKHSGSADE